MGVYTNGNIYDDGNAYSNNYFHNSDRRLKADIKPMAGLDLVEKLTGVQFRWKKDGTLSDGVIAQDVEKVMPEAVVTNAATGMKTVSYDELIAPMIEAIKQLKAENDNLTAANAAIKADAAVLKAANDNLSAEEQKLEARVNALERARGN